MGQQHTKLPPTSVNGHRLRSSVAAVPTLPPATLQFLSAALRKQWKCYRKQLKKCQRKFSERSVHDLRVAARRLESLLDLLASFLAPGRLEKTQSALKRHLDTFDELRDTQVQLPVVRKFREGFPSASRFYRCLKKREARLTRSTCRKARDLRSRRLSKLINGARKDVRQWLRRADPGQPDALLMSAVNHAFALTRQRKNAIHPGDTHSIHRTRVAFKRFRYVLEALAGRLPGARESLLARMHEYQTLMGDIQDAEVLLRAFQKFMRREKCEPKAALRFERELQQRRRKLIAKYLEAADQLLEFWPLPGGYLGGPVGRPPGKGRARGRANAAPARRKGALFGKTTT